MLFKTCDLMQVGGFNPSEKYESQLGSLFPKNKRHVQNHQPEWHL